MILETLACTDFSRKPQVVRKGGKKGKSGKKKPGKKVQKPGKKKPCKKVQGPGKKVLGPGEKVQGPDKKVQGPGVGKKLKMDAKNVHSRAYHGAYQAAKKAGKPSADCRSAGQQAAKLAVLFM